MCNRVIILKKFPIIKPSEIPLSGDDEGYVAHLECKGASFHEIYYVKGIARCSEPRCVVNKLGGCR